MAMIETEGMAIIGGSRHQSVVPIREPSVAEQVESREGVLLILDELQRVPLRDWTLGDLHAYMRVADDFRPNLTRSRRPGDIPQLAEFANKHRGESPWRSWIRLFTGR